MHCYICGHAQEPGVGRCDRCKTSLRAPETAIVPTALDVYNATRAAASAPPDVANALFAAVSGAQSGHTIAATRLNAPRDEGGKAAELEAAEPAPFNFDELFTPPQTEEPVEQDEPEDVGDGDEEKPKRRPQFAKDGPGAIRLVAVAIAVVGVLAFVGYSANKSDPPEEQAPLAFTDQPGFPTTATRSIPDLTKRIEPVLFDLKPNACTNDPVALAIDRDRLITQSTSVDPGQRVTIKFEGEKIGGQVIGGTRSPALAVIVLDDRLDMDQIDIPPLAGPLELDSPKAAVYTDGKFRFVKAKGPFAGWAGPNHGLELRPDVAHGTFAFLPSGRFAGMVNHGLWEPSVVSSKAAIDDALNRIARGAGDDFGCQESLAAAQRSTYGDNEWGRDQATRPNNRVFEPFADRCTKRDWASCDRLRHVAVYNSQYILVARSCGGALSPEERSTLSPEQESLGCSRLLALRRTADVVEPFVGACLALPRSGRQRAVITDCFAPHDAEVVSVGRSAAKCTPSAQKINTDLYWDRDLFVAAVKTPKTETVVCFLYDPGYTLTEALPNA